MKEFFETESWVGRVFGALVLTYFAAAAFAAAAFFGGLILMLVDLILHLAATELPTFAAEMSLWLIQYGAIAGLVLLVIFVFSLCFE